MNAVCSEVPNVCRQQKKDIYEVKETGVKRKTDGKRIEPREDFDRLGEECGVFGIYDFSGENVASTIYYGLFALSTGDRRAAELL